MVASASGVPVRRPTTTCLPRRAVRGVPDRLVRSPDQGGRVLLCRTAPGWPGVRGVLCSRWRRAQQGPEVG